MKKYTGKNLEEILDKIADEYSCDISRIKYTVLEEKKGILGIGNSMVVEAYTSHDVKEFIFDYLGSYFVESDIETEIEIYEEDDTFKVILDTEKNPVIIGKNGQTLFSINKVLKTAVTKVFKTRIEILVDVNNYKEDKYRKITKIAHRVAKQVKRTKVEATLDNLTNDERKVVHQELSKYQNIKTQSVGEGKDRKLTIKYVENKEDDK